MSNKKQEYAIIKKVKEQLNKLQAAYDLKYKSTKRIKVRTKGHSFEREIARLFQFVGYTQAQRQLEYQVNQAQGIDLAGTGRYKVQCKKTKKYVPLSTINEIKYKDGDVPVLIAAGDSEPPLAVMRLEDFLELVSSSASDEALYGTDIKSANAVRAEMKRIRGGGK